MHGRQHVRFDGRNVARSLESLLALTLARTHAGLYERLHARAHVRRHACTQGVLFAKTFARTDGGKHGHMHALFKHCCTHACRHAGRKACLQSRTFAHSHDCTHTSWNARSLTRKHITGTHAIPQAFEHARVHVRLRGTKHARLHAGKLKRINAFTDERDHAQFYVCTHACTLEFLHARTVAHSDARLQESLHALLHACTLAHTDTCTHGGTHAKKHAPTNA